MLPTELLKAIFCALSRDDLDALMLTSVLFRDVVLRDFANEPFRFLEDLHIDRHQNYRFDLSTQNRYRSEDNDDFSRRMRLARVDKLQ